MPENGTCRGTSFLIGPASIMPRQQRGPLQSRIMSSSLQHWDNEKYSARKYIISGTLLSSNLYAQQSAGSLQQDRSRRAVRLPPDQPPSDAGSFLLVPRSMKAFPQTFHPFSANPLTISSATPTIGCMWRCFTAALRCNSSRAGPWESKRCLGGPGAEEVSIRGRSFHSLK